MRIAATISTCLVLMSLSGLPSAQDTGPGLVEEIVVTARFREESAQDVGASISAYGEQAIRDLGVENMSDLAFVTPGLNLQDRGPNRNEISVRGVGRLVFPQDLLPVSNAIGTYFDDVPLNINIGTQIDMRFFDLERVEVLRGPQGTLFGEGAEGGAVRYVSKDPSLEAAQAIVEADFNRVSHGESAFGARAALSIPLARDRAGLRLVVNRVTQGGFVDNVATGTDDINDFEAVNVRAVFLAEPNDRFRIRLVATHEEMDQDTFWFVTGDPDDLELDFFSDDGFVEDDYDLVSANLSYDFGPLKVESITSYLERDRHRYQIDNVFGGLNTVAVTFAFGSFTRGDTFADDKTSWEQFSQEVRLLSDFDGPFNFVAGLFYRDFDLEITGTNCSPVYLAVGFPAECGDDIFAVLNPSGEPRGLTTNSGEQISAFFEATWSINDRLRLIAGLRSHNEDVDLATGGATFSLFGFSTVGALSESASINELLPKVGLEFDLSDAALLYLTYSAGARNGNLNSPITMAQIEAAFGPGSSDRYRTYHPERTDAIELGVKSLLLDGTLQFNASAYYNIIDDMQAATFPGGLFAILENVGDGHAVGGDLEVTWRPTNSLLLFASLSVTEAENDDEFIFRDNLPPLPKVITPEGTDNPYTPKTSLSAGAQYAWAIEGMGPGTNLVFNVNLQHTGKYKITFEGDAEELGNFQTLNASIGLVADRWEINLRADNLLDNIEVVSIQELDSDLSPFLGPLQPADYSFNEVSHNRPRTLSLTARYSF